MKKTMIFCIIFFLSFMTGYSQWEKMNGPGTQGITEAKIFGNDLIVLSGNDLYETTDSGKSWNHINKTSEILFNGIQSFAKSKGRIFINNFSLSKDPNNGYFYTTDNGLHWEKINKGIKYPNQAAGFYTNDNELYTICLPFVYQFDFEKNEWFIAFDTTQNSGYLIDQTFNTMLITDNKMYLGNYVLYDWAKTPKIHIYDLKEKKWTHILDTISGIWRYTVNSFVKKDSLLIAGTTGGVFISKDGGITWIKKNNGLQSDDLTLEVHKLYVMNNYIYALATYPHGSAPFMVSYSIDNGESWKFPDPNLIFPNSYYSAVTALNLNIFNDRFFLDAFGSLYYATDTLSHFQEFYHPNFNGDIISDLSYDGTNLYAASAHSRNSNEGIWKSSDYGTTWQKIYNGKYSSIASKDSLVIAGAYIYKKSPIPIVSEDGGKTFNKIPTDSGLKNFDILTIKIVDTTIYLGTNQGLYYSDDRGKNWSEMDSILKNVPIYSLDIKDKDIVVGSNESKLYLSNDYGDNWKKITIPQLYLDTIGEKCYFTTYDVEIRNHTIYLATIGYYNVSVGISYYGGGLLGMDKTGTSIRKIGYYFPDHLGISNLEMLDDDWLDYFTFVTAKNTSGFYYIRDYSDVFIQHNMGLSSSSINKLLIAGRYIFAATNQGVYRIPLSDFGITDIEELDKKPDYLWASQPYPIPARDYVYSEIYFDNNTEIQPTDISVYNVMGNKVDTKDKIAILPKTEYSGLLRWECTGVPSGIYIITFQHGTKRRTMNILKE